MTFTPFISIYTESDFNNTWSGNDLIKAIWVFSKNLGYNKKLSRTRVNIHVGTEDRIHTAGRIKSIWIRSSVDATNEISDTGKVNQILKVIAESLKTIGSAEGWEMEPIEKAFELSIADNGQFVWYSKLISNKKRDLKGRIKILLEKEGKVKISAECFDNRSNLQFEIHIIDTFPHLVDWNKTFSKPAWIDNEELGFSLINAQLLIFANCRSRQSETIIAEKSYTREEVEGYLRMLTYRKFSDNKEVVDWINQ